jgi:predicted ATPase/class 3 adenylate cyclase
MHDLPTGTVTLLFTDMQDSTLLVQRLGDRWPDVLAACRRLLRGVFRRYHGREVDTQGDAFFVVFPRATEAVAAAVEMQRALSSYDWGSEGAGDITVRWRVGAHTGEPRRTDEGYAGLDVHLAARICSAGHGGQVLLSQTTRDLVAHTLPEGVDLRDLGARQLKGLPRISQLFQLVIPGLPADFPPLKTLETLPNNLPTPPSTLIGREREVAAISQALLREGTQLVTLTGPGGVGKTRLALQVAASLTERFPDGVWFVALAPIWDSGRVIPAIAQTIGLREAPDRSPLRHTQDHLLAKKTLLVLDNFEQVIEAAPAVAELLAVCPRLKILVTSRERLHVRAERDTPVAALALPDTSRLPDLDDLTQYPSVALFVERAQAVKPEFEVTAANARAIANICARLDGLPLAIELAAARTNLFPPHALLARLTRRLSILTQSVRDAPERQQTLRHTIQWSYDLLSEAERRLFRRLAIFAGGCSFDAIEAVSAACGDDPSLVVDVLTSLLDKSLLRQIALEGEDMRLSMLETVREYAWDMLAASDELDRARQAHAAYFQDIAAQAARELRGSRVTEWLKRLNGEQDNLRAAVAWALEPAHDASRLESAFNIGDTLARFCDLRGLYSEGRDILDQLVARRADVAPPIQARTLFHAAEVASAQADYDEAEAWYEESLALYRELGDKRGVSLCLHGLGWLAVWKRNNFVAARTLLEERLAIAREIGDKKDIAAALANLGDMMCYIGDYRAGFVMLEDGLAIYRQIGHKRGIAFCLRQSAGTLLWEAWEDVAVIKARLDECLAIYQALDDKVGQALHHFFAGWLALRQEDVEAAGILLTASAEHFNEMGDRWHESFALTLLGRTEERQGDFSAARTLHERALAIVRALGDYAVGSVCLDSLASVTAAGGEYVKAARLWGAAEALRAHSGFAFIPIERPSYDLAVAAARAQLGAATMDAAWAAGRALMPEQALAEV